MEIKFINYLYNEKEINFTIEYKTITGIAGTSLKDYIEILTQRKQGKGTILVNEEKITKENIKNYQKRISFIPNLLVIPKYVLTVNELMKQTIKQNNLIIKDYSKKIRDSLKIVGLDESYLERTLQTLSQSEKKILQYALSLISNPELIIVEEPFKFLDNKNEKKIFMLLQRLKEQFNINIILLSTDQNALHKYTDNMIFIKNNQVILEGPTTEVYQRVDFLKKNKFLIPEIIEFTYLAKKKKSVKIDYHKDIRDIIKDIYKHVLFTIIVEKEVIKCVTC